MIGRTVSHYKILEHLGGGGMGVVYRAQDLKLDRSVALKFLSPDLTREPEARQRFIHEAQAASGLQHSNICVVHDVDETRDGQMFIAMEYLQGKTLRTMIERGPLRYFEWEWEDAIAILKRALELNPHEANVHYHLSWFYVLLGRWDEALAEHKRAQELDPLLPAYTAWLGLIYQCLGRYDEAIAECRKALEIDPHSPTAYQILGGIYAEQGKFEESIAAYEKAGAADSSWRYAICEGYAAAGRYDDIRKLLTELETLEPTPWSAFWRARIHTLLGNKDEAFRWLSYQPSHVWVPWEVASAPKLLRDDPRLDSLRNRFRLPPPTATPAER